MLSSKVFVKEILFEIKIAKSINQMRSISSSFGENSNLMELDDMGVMPDRDCVPNLTKLC